jgi:hypothetical protein
VLNEEFYMASMAVFTRPDGGIRIVYPKKNNMPCFYPIKKEIGAFIEKTVQEKLNNYLTNLNYEFDNSQRGVTPSGS